MSSQQSQRSNFGLGFGAVLTLLLVGLRAFNIIHWPWWLVFVPGFVSAAVSIVLLFMFIVVLALAGDGVRRG